MNAIRRPSTLMMREDLAILYVHVEHEALGVARE
jgi:hypothetical protein